MCKMQYLTDYFFLKVQFKVGRLSLAVIPTNNDYT